MSILHHIRRRLARLQHDQSGSATVEFVIIFPLVMMIFIMGLESGYYKIREAMLDRATAIVGRNVGLNRGDLATFEDLRTALCDRALIIPDCDESLEVEMWVIDMINGNQTVEGTAPCAGGSGTENVLSLANFRVAAANQLVVMRVCSLSDPMFPTSLLAANMAVDETGDYAVVTKVAFVMEPEDGTIGSPGGSTGVNQKPVDPCADGGCTGEPWITTELPPPEDQG